MDPVPIDPSLFSVVQLCLSIDFSLYSLYFTCNIFCAHFFIGNIYLKTDIHINFKIRKKYFEVF